MVFQFYGKLDILILIKVIGGGYLGTLAKRELLRKSFFSITVISLIGFFVLIGEMHNINIVKNNMNQEVVSNRIKRMAEVDFDYKKILIDNFELNHGEDQGYKDELAYWLSQIDINKRSFDVVIFNEQDKQIYYNGIYNLEGLKDQVDTSQAVYTGHYNKFGWSFVYIPHLTNSRTLAKAEANNYFSANVGTRMFIAVLVCASVFGLLQYKVLSGYVILKKNPNVEGLADEKYKDSMASMEDELEDELLVQNMGVSGINMREFIFEIINAYKHINPTNCDYEVMCKESLKMSFDKKEMARVVTSIFENSDKHGFSNAKGQVVIKIKGEKHRTTISISDNGIGMGEEEIRYLEQSFHSLELIDHKSRSSLQHTYHYIVNVLKGEMKIESTVGLGSKFTMRI